jgi:hypothetical protein
MEEEIAFPPLFCHSDFSFGWFGFERTFSLLSFSQVVRIGLIVCFSVLCLVERYVRLAGMLASLCCAARGGFCVVLVVEDDEVVEI